MSNKKISRLNLFNMHKKNSKNKNLIKKNG